MVVCRDRPPLLAQLLLIECALKPPTTRAKKTTQNPGENTREHQPGTFRNGHRQLDGGLATSTTLSGGASFSFETKLVFCC